MHRCANLRSQLARDSDAEHRWPRVSHDQRSCSRSGSHRCERRQRTVIRTGAPRRRFVARCGRCPAGWDALKIKEACMSWLHRGAELAIASVIARFRHSRLACPVAANARVWSSHAGEHQRCRHGHVKCRASRCHRRGHWTGIAKTGRGRQQRRRRVPD